ncbi:hypothetical protein JCM17843_11470 [Kordiimonadales bacterium JCM 17843]|nr:hypothetical protein JCM17843_11470 [Kordiimonadales bacterium JCM 17843]
MTGAGVLVESLVQAGARMAFGVPGESYLAVLDALHDVRDRLPFITCRMKPLPPIWRRLMGNSPATPAWRL